MFPSKFANSAITSKAGRIKQNSNKDRGNNCQLFLASDWAKFTVQNFPPQNSYFTTPTYIGKTTVLRLILKNDFIGKCIYLMKLCGYVRCAG